ncbi:MAG: DUF2490 domain-containing protein [Bacteroidales bacterium]|nr:DUF2490 domain-containing protein [Bacteroidales bacterium]
MKTGIRHIIVGYLILLPYLDTKAQELRLGINYEKNILPKLEIDSKVQLRKVMNQSNAYYAIVQAGLDYELSENISFSGSVRYTTSPVEIDEETVDGINEKLRYVADFRLKTKRLRNDIKISNRLRYQHSAIFMDDNRNYIRNKLSVEYRLNQGMKPFIAVEPYLLLEEQRIRKLRFYLGSEFELFNSEFELCFIIEGQSMDEVITIFHKVGIHYKL